MKDVMVLSVGGSPQPLRSAIDARRWDRVVFVVSDGSGKSAASRPMVEDREIDYDRAGGVRGPGLRHLPACPGDVGIIAVPPDDLDRALAIVDTALAAEMAQGAQVTVNYTGGTKTMTAALVLAGAAHEGARLEFMAGARLGLDAVAPGTEAAVEMPGHLLGLANLFATVRAFTALRSYQSALQTLREIERLVKDGQNRRLARPPGSWTRRIEDWRAFLNVLDLWDRFDHGKAHRRLSEALDRGAAWAEAMERDGFAVRLAALADRTGATALLCEDLWLNAQRRATLGLFDDAIARLYRLAEATVQARLAEGFRIDTGRVPCDRLPDLISARETVRRDEKTDEAFFVLGLFRSLELLAHLSPADTIVQVWPRRDSGDFETPGWQGERNKSILAHGFRPLGPDEWKKAHEWFHSRRMALWEGALGRSTASQLPDTLP